MYLKTPVLFGGFKKHIHFVQIQIFQFLINKILMIPMSSNQFNSIQF